MKKSVLYMSVFACFALLAACEKTETALTEEETAHSTEQAATKAKSNTKSNTQKPLKITAGEPARPAPVEPEPEHVAQVQQPKLIEPSAPAVKSPSPPPPSPVSAPIPARAIAFPVKRCMNMGNALEAENEGDWGYRITVRDLRKVAAAGFDTVRIPIRWDTHTAHRTPYAVDAQYMSRIKTVVRDAQNAGLGVIIDVHHYENLMTRTTRETPRFLAIWEQIARTFSAAPSNVYFEVLNEPTHDISNAQINTLYAKVIPIIRAYNPTRKIIMGGNSWNSIDTIGKVRWSKWSHDKNLVATFHDYGPHEFTHQGAEWSEPVMPLGRRWGGKADMAELKDTYKIARNFRAKTGLPILVGEFGVIDKVPLAERNQWIKTRRKTIEANGYAWCAWDFSGAFKTYDTATGQWLPGTLDALFGR